MATVVESDTKTSFSIVTTPKCRGRCYSFPWIAPLTLNPHLIMMGVEQRGIKYHFWVFGMNGLGIEPRSPESLANTLLTTPVFCYVREKNWNKITSHYVYHILSEYFPLPTENFSFKYISTWIYNFSILFPSLTKYDHCNLNYSLKYEYVFYQESNENFFHLSVWQFWLIIKRPRLKEKKIL